MEACQVGAKVTETSNTAIEKQIIRNVNNLNSKQRNKNELIHGRDSRSSWKFVTLSCRLKSQSLSADKGFEKESIKFIQLSYKAYLIIPCGKTANK